MLVKTLPLSDAVLTINSPIRIIGIVNFQLDQLRARTDLVERP